MFRDIVHGDITFEGPTERAFVTELIGSPEVQRLRFMRMLNQDAQYMQELATSRRFAHAVGTCYTAYEISRRSAIGLEARLTLLAAALIHDIGILPYGHLVEQEFARLDPFFSHEKIARAILYGTYHPTNVYHQLLPGLSLEISAILARYEVQPEHVLDLVKPGASRATAISGPIDVDNVDNVHRMAALLGYPGAASNLRRLICTLRVDKTLQLCLDPAGVEAVSVWLEYRRSIYSQMIGHPTCVAYNAFLQDLVRQAIRLEVIRPDLWYLSDLDFESRLLEDSQTKALANQLRTGCKYRLLDYAWIELSNCSRNPIPRELADGLVERLPPPPVEGAVYRSWHERNKITRRFELRLTDPGRSCTFGSPSFVVLVAMIDPGVIPDTRFERFRLDHGPQLWRRHVADALDALGMTEGAQLYYPEDNAWKGVMERDSGEQLRLL